jgi:hypothetical protein
VLRHRARNLIGKSGRGKKRRLASRLTPPPTTIPDAANGPAASFLPLSDGAFLLVSRFMQRSILILALVWSSAGLFAADKVFDFKDTKDGAVPPGFRPVLAGTGRPGEWKVVTDVVPSLLAPLTPNAAAGYKQPVLAQVSRDQTDERFPILVYDDETFGDFTLTTRFKIVEGQVEQMAGIAFRMQDERNYYYIRASALGGTFYFLKILNGERIGPIGNKVPIEKGVWHEMTIECKGTRVRDMPAAVAPRGHGDGLPMPPEQVIQRIPGQGEKGFENRTRSTGLSFRRAGTPGFAGCPNRPG